MSKKDRIASAISVLYMFFPLIVMFKEPQIALIFTIPVVIYWGYRFIKNDISFLSNKSNDNV